MVREDEELQSRAKMFIRRELQVFEWAAENAEFILEYILAMVKTIDLKGSSGAAEDMLTDFLGRENAGIFCHELAAFLRSPFSSLQSFDNFVQYEKPLPSVFDEDGLPIETNISRKRRRATEVENDESVRATEVENGVSRATTVENDESGRARRRRLQSHLLTTSEIRGGR